MQLKQLNWDYRVIAYEENSEILYEIRPVIYTEGLPTAYGEPATIIWSPGESPIEIINRLRSSLTKPYLSEEIFNVDNKKR